ncbi:AFG1-like ATPase-domain-containing protein [Cubamyces menziesii]|nr:AFG1-like ATPase-domain-containing protein [Cubamyces menziesii]
MNPPSLSHSLTRYSALGTKRHVAGPRTTSRLSDIAANRIGLPAQIDLLDRYRGLVALGRIKEDDEQIRVIMKLRRLHKELEGYAPPAVLARHLNQTHAVSAAGSESDESGPWWAASEPIQPPETSRGLIRVRTHAEEIDALTTPKGLLITGPPGSGKSFLIDLWFSTLPTPFKARKHYNELVLEIYRAVWEETRRRMATLYASNSSPESQAEEPSKPWNKLIRDQWRQLLKTGSLPSRWTRRTDMSFSLSRTSIEPSIAYVVAQRLILRHWLLVFDEIQLLDVSSATLLADVLSWFWRMGGIIVGSSNKVPDDLYKNGVQRERLEPFVEALKARCPVVLMRSDRDWRAIRGSVGQRSWYTREEAFDFEMKLRDVIGASGDPSSGEHVVFGRKIKVPWEVGDACKFSFAELCDESLGPADYITLASRYRTFIITGIPVLKLSAKNQARRFISLIDALYEARCRIICLAEAAPERLFFPDAPLDSEVASTHTTGDRSVEDVDVMMAEAVGETQEVYRPNVASYDAPNMERERTPSTPLALDKLSIFSGKDEQFAFKRALSRLLEMTSESYARDEQWAPLPPSSRKWESSSTSHQPSATVKPTPSQPTDPVHNTNSDFAEEASAYSSSHAHATDRPPAPRLSADHIWGVREDWGPRARAWGRGASAYSNRDPPLDDDSLDAPSVGPDARHRESSMGDTMTAFTGGSGDAKLRRGRREGGDGTS